MESDTDEVEYLASEINAHGFRGYIVSRDGRTINFDAPPGRFRGNAIAGCLCSFLDKIGTCLGDKGCPSASFHHVMIKDGRKEFAYFKLCPVLFADVTGAFEMNPDGGAK